MRVLLLGATGTIGRAVLHALIARGHEVVALARSETSAEKIARLGATIVRAVARRLGVATPVLDIMSEDAAAQELGECARGYACNQRLSGAKARKEFGWAPKHLDPTRGPMELCA